MSAPAPDPGPRAGAHDAAPAAAHDALPAAAHDALPAAPSAPPPLRIVGLTVAYGDGRRPALLDVDLEVPRGTAVGLVGESGSGKSTLALAALRALPVGGRVVAGRVELAGADLYALAPRALRAVWRSHARLVPQDPLGSLNPSLTVGRQLAEAIPPASERGRPGPRDGGVAPDAHLVHEALAAVGLADPERVARSYPHQLSGGMQQRVAIAMALAGRPDLLVMDEPTTNLDVTTEATILDLVRALRREYDAAVLYVSHSLAVVAQLCDRVAVLYAGELVEEAPVADVYRAPWHPYTRGLLDSLPRVGRDRHTDPLRPIAGRLPAPHERPQGCVFAQRCPVALPRCFDERPELEAAADGRRVRCHRWPEIAAGDLDPGRPAAADPAPTPAPAPTSAPDAPPALRVRGLVKSFATPRSALDWLRRRPAKRVRAVDDVSLAVDAGRTLGLVGESGSGKSTLARSVIGLWPPDRGSVELRGRKLGARVARRRREDLRALQMVFQNSGEALNPHLTVGQALARPLRRLARVPRRELRGRVLALLESVHLDADFADRLPAALSGGEQQRVAIARAFACDPDVVVFDESVSGLDVSVQAAILELLTGLQDVHRGGYAFVSHDLAVVAYLADEIAVMYLGGVVEAGATAAVLRPPYHPYTEALLSAVPRPEPERDDDRVRLEGDPPSPVAPPSGCPFHPRCPRSLGALCVEQAPPWRVDPASGKGFACHLEPDELRAVQRDLFAEGEAGA